MATPILVAMEKITTRPPNPAVLTEGGWIVVGESKDQRRQERGGGAETGN